MTCHPAAHGRGSHACTSTLPWRSVMRRRSPRLRPPRRRPNTWRADLARRHRKTARTVPAPPIARPPKPRSVRGWSRRRTAAALAQRSRPAWRPIAAPTPERGAQERSPHAPERRVQERPPAHPGNDAQADRARGPPQQRACHPSAQPRRHANDPAPPSEQAHRSAGRTGLRRKGHFSSKVPILRLAMVRPAAANATRYATCHSIDQSGEPVVMARRRATP